MANSKPIRAAFELKKLQAFHFHLIYSTLNLGNWFLYRKQILLGGKLWPALHVTTHLDFKTLSNLVRKDGK